MADIFAMNVEDGIATIWRGTERVGRALTQEDGIELLRALNERAGDFRDRLLSAVTDAVEDAFEGAD